MNSIEYMEIINTELLGDYDEFCDSQGNCESCIFEYECEKSYELYRTIQVMTDIIIAHGKIDVVDIIDILMDLKDIEGLD